MRCRPVNVNAADQRVSPTLRPQHCEILGPKATLDFTVHGTSRFASRYLPTKRQSFAPGETYPSLICSKVMKMPAATRRLVQGSPGANAPPAPARTTSTTFHAVPTTRYHWSA